jgi:lipopolysaccharide export system permease protein
VIIFRYLVKEVAKTQLAVFFVLMTIFISRKFVAVLGDASEGGIPGQLVMVFIGLNVPYLAGMLLPLSLFLGILLAYGRIYAESEMTVLHACGVSEWYVVRVTLVLGLLTALVTGLFTFYLSPLSTEYESQLKDKIAADSGLTSLVAGRFQKTGNDKAVVFVHEKNRADNSLSKVFVAQLPDADNKHANIINSSLVYAKQGQVIDEESGSQRLVLEQGTRYQSDAKSGEFRSVAFAKYYIQIQDQKVAHKRRKLNATPTTELFSEPAMEYQAELHWRLAFPLAAFIVVFIAVPLSVVNPRQGKFAKMFPALMLFLAYFLLLTSMRSVLEKGGIPIVVGLWPIHLFALLFGLTLLVKQRSSGRRFKAKLPNLFSKGAVS